LAIGDWRFSSFGILGIDFLFSSFGILGIDLGFGIRSQTNRKLHDAPYRLIKV